MNTEQALHELAAMLGIAGDYYDVFGNRHETSHATRLALLQAMGALEQGEAAAAALAQRHDREFLRSLPPVLVLRQEQPCSFPVALPEAQTQDTLRWTLTLENGEQRQGELVPAQCPIEGERSIDGRHYRRHRCSLEQALPLGYHRLRLALPQGEARMSLIIAPVSCYRPPAIADDGRVWGLSTQLYAMRSLRNWGIGDYSDVRAGLEVCARSGAALLGVNPLHALFPHNPRHISPYSPSSRLFQNALYLDVEALPEFADCEAARSRVAEPEFQARLRALRARELVDYEGVAQCKMEVLELLHAHFQTRHRSGASEHGRAFERYLRSQGQLLQRFALYHALQEHLHADDSSIWGWPVWPQEYRHPDLPAVQAFAHERRERVEYYCWLQWQCDRQLAAAGRRSWELGLGVGLYLDLAVSVDRAGAESWSWQEQYALGVSVGAPPDDFNRKGQDWGLPPLIPERLRESAYLPFIETLRANMRHAGALRIDHVMGLCRLYWIAPGGGPKDGAYVYYPMHDLLGIVALESQRNRCLVIGEDLGTVPDELRAAMGPTGVLSYRLLIFEKQVNGEFKPPASYPADALVAITTHDLPSLQGYWKGHDLDLRAGLNLFPDEAVRAGQIVARAQDRAWLLVALEREGLLPPGMTADPASVAEMSAELAQAIALFLARTPSRIAIMQMEDVLGQLEQVNLPGTTDQHPNWQRKLALNLEEWQQDRTLQALAQLFNRERSVGAASNGPAFPSARPVIPRCTYRLQFHAGFTFAHAAELVPYLHALGVSHVYASPYLKARAGSQHGYDIIDHGALNPELGSHEDFERYVSTLQQHGMGQIIDVVPNHMGVMGADNGWWLDVLENGSASVHAICFDIDWDPVNEDLKGKVLVPVLGEQYGVVLDAGELKLEFDRVRGEFSVRYFTHRFPIDPRAYPHILALDASRLDARLGNGHPQALEFHSLITAFSNLPARDERDAARLLERGRDKEVHKRHLSDLCERSPDVAQLIAENVLACNGVRGEPASFDRLHQLLQEQAYRLSYWKVASDEINYRRFFDINELAALRMENADVFDATHRFVFRMLERGQVQGLRVDHPDGLYDPLQYFRRLQYRQANPPAAVHDSPEPRSTYVVVEKILAENEHLPHGWPVFGTTGYEFTNLLNGLFVNTRAEARMERFYRLFTRDNLPYEQLLYRAKMLIMRTALAGELNVLGNALLRIARADRHTCDFTLNGLRHALREVVACMPVYRTYISGPALREDEQRHVDSAIGMARRQSTAGDESIFDFLREVLTAKIAEGKPEAFRQQVLEFVMKLQQFTSPVMAKGLEDTSFYIYNRLTSLNEVGGNPRRFGVTPLAFHRANRERQRNWPHSQLSTSTHDSKRSEDVRTRLDALSELADEWRQRVMLWERINRGAKRSVLGRRAPSRNDEYLLYQTLLGIWPAEPLDEAGLAAVRARLRRYMLKAVREAKVHTSWVNPGADYEAALLQFIDSLLERPPDQSQRTRFLEEFLPLQRKIARLGVYNSLSQTLLKLTAPGVPDIYQGCELFAFNLVDPDNRREVDYGRRRDLLAQLQALHARPESLPAALRALLDNAHDDRCKLYVTWVALQLRARHVELFEQGDYHPLTVSGTRAEQVVAFARTHGGSGVIVVTSRLLHGLGDGGEVPVGAAVWGDTVVTVQGLPPAAPIEEVFTRRALTLPDQGRLPLGELLGYFPVALLHYTS